METRIYEVTDKDEIMNHGRANGVPIPRLVEAINQSQALRFVTSNRFTVEIADAKRVAELVGGGMKVEKGEVKS